MADGYYYHAGVEIDDQTIVWSRSTRTSHARAEREARAMARARGGRPLVEWWSRRHGLRPGDCGAVEGAAYVD